MYASCASDFIYLRSSVRHSRNTATVSGALSLCHMEREKSDGSECIDCMRGQDQGDEAMSSSEWTEDP